MKKELYKETGYPGIKQRISDNMYIVTIDLGRQLRLNKKTGLMEMKQASLHWRTGEWVEFRKDENKQEISDLVDSVCEQLKMPMLKTNPLFAMTIMSMRNCQREATKDNQNS